MEADAAEFRTTLSTICGWRPRPRATTLAAIRLRLSANCGDRVAGDRETSARS